MKYRIVIAPSASELENAVNVLLDLGWVLQGGLFSNEKGFMQAMIKSK
ncbi:DUF1737 domain-containing protein [Chryseobacterium sp. YR221]|nr:DUF1737 domain-containing protein [Chryseobacterium sp. YR221]SMC38257.1 protein of unknown function [Chryseobacterium sp. YR221]